MANVPLPTAVLLLAAACGGDDAAVDSGTTADAGMDAARLDGGPRDPDTDASADAGELAPLHLLVFTRTTGYRHASIADGVAAMDTLGAERGWEVVATEDPASFTDEALSTFSVVVFLSTTGDVLDPAGEAALERFVRGGGGWVGVHSASDTEYDWPWYGELVGAWFEGHPAIQTATLTVDDPTHPSTAHLDPTFTRRDEWYNFRTNPRGTVEVVLTLDESTYTGGTMGDHPIAWHHAIDDGRAFYTAGGHTSESWSEPGFLAHVAGAVEWAAGR